MHDNENFNNLNTVTHQLNTLQYYNVPKKKIFSNRINLRENLTEQIIR